MNMADIIKDIMKRQGINQKKLADRVGISKQAVSQMLNSEDMKVSTARMLLGALGYCLQVVREDEDDA